jgi:hypothetical protein
MTPTMEELRTLRAALTDLEEKRDLAAPFRRDGVDQAIAYDVALKRWALAENQYSLALRAWLEAGHE